MALDVSWSIRIPTEKQAPSPIAPSTPNTPTAPSANRLRPIIRRLWTALVNAVSGPGLNGGGIDESAFPSGFIAPYGRGSRQVRNLWHMPF